MRKVVVIAFCLLLSNVAWAEDCSNLPSEEIMGCADQESEKAEKILGKVYREQNKRLRDDHISMKYFHETEKLWLKFKQHECTPAHGIVSVGGLALSKLCVSAARVERAKELQKFLDLEDSYK